MRIWSRLCLEYVSKCMFNVFIMYMFNVSSRVSSQIYSWWFMYITASLLLYLSFLNCIEVFFALPAHTMITIQVHISHVFHSQTEHGIGSSVNPLGGDLVPSPFLIEVNIDGPTDIIVFNKVLRCSDYNVLPPVLIISAAKLYMFVLIGN